MIFDSGDTGDVGGYTIANSLRLRSSASAYLSRTLGTATNRKKSTTSLWVKRGALGRSTLFSSYSSGTDRAFLEFDSSDRINFDDFISSQSTLKTSTAVFRDPSACYHIVVAIDTDQATAEDRVIIWVNNSRITSWTTNTTPGLSINPGINAPRSHFIGQTGAATGYADGLISEVNFIDGQALDPSYFGQFNSDGVWVPKAYTGTYGTNGFYLKFNDGSNLTNLCLDRSGNGNNWTATNVSLTAGATYDWMVDTPTNNYCTWTPLDATTNKPTNGNLRVGHNAAEATRATLFRSSGKWYFEFVYDTMGNGSAIGIGASSASNAQYPGYDANGYGFNPNTGNKNNAGVSTAYGASCTTGDVIGIAYDLDNGKVWWAKNGTWQASGDPAAGSNAAFSSIVGEFAPMFGISNVGSGSGGSANFGQRPFAYTPPTGFKALCTANLPAVAMPNGRKHFDVLLHTGNGGAQSVTGAQFQPDFAITKARSQANSHTYYDVVRGATKALFSNTTGAELDYSAYLAGFLSNGVSFIGGGGDTNQNGATYVNWLWKAGGAAVTNNAGSISSQVSANTAAGISIVTYTAPASGSFSVGHGLGAPVAMVIAKTRGVTGNWGVWHKSLTNATDYYLNMNTTAASTLNSGIWGAGHTSSVTGGLIGSSDAASTTAVRYVFAEVPGFSKFGSYTGNGSTDGPFVFCGFRPRWVLVKRTDVANDWHIIDTVRSTVNVAKDYLLANSSQAELASLSIDITSNGFKLRDANAWGNASGGTYIFAAFAENPFGGSNVAPATAR